MALFEIPLPPTTSPPPGSFDQVTDLGGEDFSLSFQWHARDELWTLDLRTSAGEDVALGLVLVPGRFLLRRLVGDPRPAGDIVVVGPGSRVGFADLGGTARLLYADGEDLAEMRAATEPA